MLGSSPPRVLRRGILCLLGGKSGDDVARLVVVVAFSLGSMGGHAIPLSFGECLSESGDLSLQGGDLGGVPVLELNRESSLGCLAAALKRRPAFVPDKSIILPTKLNDDILPLVLRGILVKLVLDLNHSKIERCHIGGVIAAGEEHRQIIRDVLGSEAFVFDAMIVQFRAKILGIVCGFGGQTHADLDFVDEISTGGGRYHLEFFG
jgi:hypothetical protein